MIGAAIQAIVTLFMVMYSAVATAIGMAEEQGVQGGSEKTLSAGKPAYMSGEIIQSQVCPNCATKVESGEFNCYVCGADMPGAAVRVIAAPQKSFAETWAELPPILKFVITIILTIGICCGGWRACMGTIEILGRP